LFLMSAPDAALARMKQRYGPLVAGEWTTLPELWNGGTHNHAWSGGPLTLLSQYAAGLAPLTPGWATYQVRPQPGALRSIDATVDSVAGRITVALRREDAGRLGLKLDSPGGTTALVILPIDPAYPPRRITANDQVVWKQGGGAVSGPRGLRLKSASGDSFTFEAASGLWEFKTEP